VMFMIMCCGCDDARRENPPGMFHNITVAAVASVDPVRAVNHDSTFFVAGATFLVSNHHGYGYGMVSAAPWTAVALVM
jgi:hypothetical protein